jgi:nucleoside-diphosphate-sugar epimerase
MDAVMSLGIVAVTGATGYVGRFVVAELQRQGVRVRALSRPESNRDGFDAPIDWISGDLHDAAARQALVQGADAMIHLAYEHVPGKYRGGEGDDLQAWLDANLNGSLQLLLDARDAASVQRFLFLSSRAVFSRTEPGRELDETHPTSPDSHYGAYKAAVEAFMHSVSHTNNLQTCSLRATGVYGITTPLERTKWWPLIDAVVHDKPIPSTGGGTEVYGGDVARTIWALLTSPTIPFDVVHLSDRYISHREVVEITRAITGKRGDLPPAPDKPPQNVMTSRNLAQLGITLGGRAQLEATIAEMIQRVQST